MELDKSLFSKYTRHIYKLICPHTLKNIIDADNLTVINTNDTQPYVIIDGESWDYDESDFKNIYSNKYPTTIKKYKVEDEYIVGDPYTIMNTICHRYNDNYNNYTIPYIRQFLPNYIYNLKINDQVYKA